MELWRHHLTVSKERCLGNGMGIPLGILSLPGPMQTGTRKHGYKPAKGCRVMGVPAGVFAPWCRRVSAEWPWASGVGAVRAQGMIMGLEDADARRRAGCKGWWRESGAARQRARWDTPRRRQGCEYVHKRAGGLVRENGMAARHQDGVCWCGIGAGGGGQAATWLDATRMRAVAAWRMGPEAGALSVAARQQSSACEQDVAPSGCVCRTNGSRTID
jgi:hypothetical protein